MEEEIRQVTRLEKGLGHCCAVQSQKSHTHVAMNSHNLISAEIENSDRTGQMYHWDWEKCDFLHPQLLFFPEGGAHRAPFSRRDPPSP